MIQVLMIMPLLPSSLVPSLGTFSPGVELIVAIERVCEISADLTEIPRDELTQKTAENGKVYFKIIYAIALTFRSSINFELVFNGKVYQTITAKY